MTERPTEQVVRAVLGPDAPELGCDECFDQLDRYVEAELEGRDPEAAVPGMTAHLSGCPACREDHESLVAMVSAERDQT